MRAQRLYRLDELTLLPCIADVVLGRPVILVSVRPRFARLRPPIEQAAQWMRRTGRARSLLDVVPEFAPYVRWSRQLYFREAFSRCEPWQDETYRFADPGACDAELHMAFKAVTCNVVYDRAFEVFAIEALRRAMPDVQVSCIGFPAETRAQHAGAFADSPLRPVRRRPVVRASVNGVFALAALAWSCAWIARRLRQRIRPAPVFCLFDVLGNTSEAHVLAEIADGGTIGLMDRRPPGAAGEWNADAQPVRCRWGEGAFDRAGALRAAAETARDVMRLWRRHRALHPAHFLPVIALPLKRAKWRGLFNLCRPRHYLGRDEYTPDHILRRGELHRIGAKSHGWSGGNYAAYSRLAPNSRYVNFDAYYCVGIRLFDAYRDRWPQDMQLRSVGTLGYARSDVMRSWPRGDAILVAMRIAFAESEYARMVRALAVAFPARRILLQMKPVDFLSREERHRIVNSITDGLPNIVAADDTIYDLISRSACLVTDISTIAAEAIYLGVPTFVADLVDQQTNIYRDLAGLCVRNAEDLVGQVDVALRDPASYPFEPFRRRMGIAEGIVPFDEIRAEMGLPVRSAPPVDGPPVLAARAG